MASKTRAALKEFSSEELGAEINSRAIEQRVLELKDEKRDRDKACSEVFAALSNLIIDSGIGGISADSIPLMKEDLLSARQFETSDDEKTYLFRVVKHDNYVWFGAFYGGLSTCTDARILTFSHTIYVDRDTVTDLAVEEFLAEFRIYCDNVFKAQAVFSGFSDKLRSALDGTSNG
jgi:hypothetical protein